MRRKVCYYTTINQKIIIEYFLYIHLVESFGNNYDDGCEGLKKAMQKGVDTDTNHKNKDPINNKNNNRRNEFNYSSMLLRRRKIRI